MGYPVEDVLAGVEHARQAGFEQIKINMVVQKGQNEASILPMVDYFRGRDMILRFIEFMDVGNSNGWKYDEVFTSQQIKSIIEAKYPMKQLDANYRGEVAKRWTLESGDLELGIISSVTEPFCGECSRARLSAIGELYTCLFATNGMDLRAILRTSESSQALDSVIEQLWENRTDRYSEIRTESGSSQQKVEMSYIGG